MSPTHLSGPQSSRLPARADADPAAVPPLPLPPLEPRLQRRFLHLVQQHLRGAEPLAHAPKALPGEASARAQAQACWRFLSNDKVDLPSLVTPAQDWARFYLRQRRRPFTLAVHDWSSLHYYSHTAKRDQTQLSNSKDRGYELCSCLLVDAVVGQPIAPVELRLRAGGAEHSSRRPAPAVGACKLDELLPTMQAARGLGLGTTLVHVIDQEADSVLHFRQWHEAGHLFLVRVEGSRLVRHAGVQKPLREVAAALLRQGRFAFSGEVVYHGHKAEQSVAEAEVVLDRPAQQHRRGKGKRESRKRIKGKALRLRLVVCQVRSVAGQLLAEWLLLSNVDAAVIAAELGLWYYWRWQVEKYYKLLKSAGQQLESWQQETALRIAKRVAVASVACCVVWWLAGASGGVGPRVRELAVRLSGRQVKALWGHTPGSLLAGLGVLMAVWAVLSNPDLLAEVLALQDHFQAFALRSPAPPQDA